LRPILVLSLWAFLALSRVRSTFIGAPSRVEAVDAIAYATKYHSEWFWKGVQHLRKLRTAR